MSQKAVCEKIWDRATSRDREGLRKYLKKAAASDFSFEKQGGEHYKLPALLMCAYKGYADIVETLIKAGVDVNQRDQKYKETALHWASGRGHTEVVEVLLRYKIDINAQTKFGITALMYAAYSGHAAVVDLLLRAKADTDVPDKNNMTALMHASQHGHSGIVGLLLKQWPKLNLQDKNGLTALMWAAQEGHTAVVELLLEAKADFALRDQEGKTASDLAKTEKIKLVLDIHMHPPTPKMIRPLPPLPVAMSPASVAAGHSPAVPVVHKPVLSPVLETGNVLSPAAVPGHRQLVCECDAIAAQLSHAPPRRDAVQQKNKLLSLLDTALAAEDFAWAGALGQQLQRLEEEASELSLSEEDYLTLADRHAELVRKVEVKCKEHKTNKHATLLIELGTKLAALKALDLSICTADGRAHTETAPVLYDASKLQQLRDECAAFVQQMELVPPTRELVQRRRAASQRLAAVEAEEEPDYALLGQLILDQAALEQEASQLALSEGDYIALSQRHPALVQEVKAMCRELALASQYSALSDWAAQLKAVKAAGPSLLATC